MKLRVVELLLVSTLPAMVLAEGGLPALSTTIATLIGEPWLPVAQMLLTW